MYSPDFTMLHTVTVRRLAWAMDTTMGKAIDFMVKLLPNYVNSSMVCNSCKDKNKCQFCGFFFARELPAKALPLLNHAPAPACAGAILTKE